MNASRVPLFVTIGPAKDEQRSGNGLELIEYSRGASHLRSCFALVRLASRDYSLRGATEGGFCQRPAIRTHFLVNAEFVLQSS